MGAGLGWISLIWVVAPNPNPNPNLNLNLIKIVTTDLRGCSHCSSQSSKILAFASGRDLVLSMASAACRRRGVGCARPDSRSVWSASSLLALSSGSAHTKAGASSTRSKRWRDLIRSWPCRLTSGPRSPILPASSSRVRMTKRGTAGSLIRTPDHVSTLSCVTPPPRATSPLTTASDSAPGLELGHSCSAPTVHGVRAESAQQTSPG